MELMATSSSFVRRGGKRQRLARADALTRESGPSAAAFPSRRGPLEGDEEVEMLVELFALGLMSATAVRDIAATAQRMAPRPQMEALASLGPIGHLFGQRASRFVSEAKARQCEHSNTDDGPHAHVVGERCCTPSPGTCRPRLPGDAPARTASQHSHAPRVRVRHLHSGQPALAGLLGPFCR